MLFDVIKYISHTKGYKSVGGNHAMKRMTNPIQAKKDFYKIIKFVNENSTPVEINGRTENESAVIMSAKDYKSLQETLYLMNDGTLNRVRGVIDDSDEIDITNGVDWNKL